MTALNTELADQDQEVRDLYYSTFFQKMHLAMSDVRYSNFMSAEANLERLKILLDDDAAA